MHKLSRLLRYDWPLHFVLLLTNWLPDNGVFLRLRGLLVSPFLGSCGKNLLLQRNVTFYNGSKIHIGRDVHIAIGCWFMAGETIHVKDEVMVGPYSVIVSSNHLRSQNSYRFGDVDQSPIEIGPGSWLCAHVVVTSGSSVGAGSVIAAGAVVSGGIPADVLAGGIPARSIKELDIA